MSVANSMGGGQNPQSLNNISGLNESVLNQGIQTFTHTKTGTVHALTGKDGSDYISFVATANYNTGDTWTMNGTTITVNFANGLPLVVGGILQGDLVVGKIDGNVLTLTHNQVESNDNILDNWYFVNPINQRGLTTYTGNTYTIDRWKQSLTNSTTNCTFTVGDGYCNWTTSKTNNYERLQQNLEGVIKAGTYTLSMLAKWSEVHVLTLRPYNYTNGSVIEALYGGGPESASSSDYQLVTYTFTMTQDMNTFGVELLKRNNVNDFANIDIKAFKLELGNRQTLAYLDSQGNWQLKDSPPNYQSELAKCQRYFFNPIRASWSDIGFGVGLSTSKHILFNIPTPVPMRTNPILTYSQNAFSTTSNYSDIIPISNIVIENPVYNSSQANIVVITTTTLDTVAGKYYILRLNGLNPATSHFYLSADL